MKKFALLLVAMVACMAPASAQKFALVDMEYILKNIPAYEMANEQLNQVSQRWQREVDELKKAADAMYKNYQSESVFLTDDQKKKKSLPRRRRQCSSTPSILVLKESFSRNVSL